MGYTRGNILYRWHSIAMFSRMMVKQKKLHMHIKSQSRQKGHCLIFWHLSQDGFHHKITTKRELLGEAREFLREIDPCFNQNGHVPLDFPVGHRSSLQTICLKPACFLSLNFCLSFYLSFADTSLTSKSICPSIQPPLPPSCSPSLLPHYSSLLLLLSDLND